MAYPEHHHNYYENCRRSSAPPHRAITYYYVPTAVEHHPYGVSHFPTNQSLAYPRGAAPYFNTVYETLPYEYPWAHSISTPYPNGHSHGNGHNNGIAAHDPLLRRNSSGLGCITDVKVVQGNIGKKPAIACRRKIGGYTRSQRNERLQVYRKRRRERNYDCNMVRYKIRKTISLRRARSKGRFTKAPDGKKATIILTKGNAIQAS